MAKVACVSTCAMHVYQAICIQQCCGIDPSLRWSGERLHTNSPSEGEQNEARLCTKPYEEGMKDLQSGFAILHDHKSTSLADCASLE